MDDLITKENLHNLWVEWQMAAESGHAIKAREYRTMYLELLDRYIEMENEE